MFGDNCSARWARREGVNGGGQVDHPGGRVVLHPGGELQLRELVYWLLVVLE